MEERTRFERATWRTLYERDIDLVILDLLHSSDAFRKRLLSVVLDEPGLAAESRFEGAWHSVLDEKGHESDLEAAWWSPKYGHITLLIEDKINAPCQPDQALRYKERAKAYSEGDRADIARTLLIAPETYPHLHKKDVAPFDAHVSLEAIAEWCCTSTAGNRSEYLQKMIAHALRRWNRSTAPGGDRRRGTQFPEIYSVLRQELARTSPRLHISNSPQAQNGWAYLQADRRGTGVLMRYRFLDHWAELILSRKSHEESAVRELLKARPLPRAEIAPRGKSEIAVWIPTPELDVEAGAESQRDQIRSAVQTLEALQAWYEDEVAQL